MRLRASIVGAILAVSVVVVSMALARDGAHRATPAVASPLLAYAQPSSSMARNGTVYLARPDGSHPRRVGVGRDPALSADGTLLAYERDAASSRTLVLRPVAGGVPETLRLARDATLVGWVGHDVAIATVDGVFLRGEGDPLWRRVVARTIGDGESPELAAVSPDGTQLAVIGQGPSGADLYVVGVADGAIHALTHDAHVAGAAWGPRAIAYSDGLAHGDVWLVGPDGNGRRQLTHARAGFVPVAFDAAGDRLLAENPATHNGRLWAVDVASGRARVLTRWLGDLFGQGISRDGKTVFAAVGCGGMAGWYGHLETLPFAGGAPRVFAKGACRGSWAT
jgi:dipeptidyl aminopeptidase/acylaminoacyl peptidase